MPQGKDPNLVACRNEAIQGDVAGRTERDHQLAQFTLHPAPDQRMIRQNVDRRSDGNGGVERRGRVVRGTEFEQTLEIVERVRRIDYFRQGWGREAFLPEASRSIQA